MSMFSPLSSNDIQVPPTLSPGHGLGDLDGG
jgi:hypothetical protein